MEQGTVSTNVYLRRIQNFAVDLQWLPCPIVPRNRWPKVRHKERRAITWEEHQRIILREPNSETKAFYEAMWLLGGSQSDIANLRAEDIDWADRVVSYSRKKTGTIVQLHFGIETERVLRDRPAMGPLFPRLAPMHEKHRAKEFHRRSRGLGIVGVSLHSYRYAWAERARLVGYPERFAQEALGHDSKAVHRAYAKKARLKLPSLEEYEKKIIPLPQAQSVA
jgi:integrase